MDLEWQTDGRPLCIDFMAIATPSLAQVSWPQSTRPCGQYRPCARVTVDSGPQSQRRADTQGERTLNWRP